MERGRRAEGRWILRETKGADPSLLFWIGPGMNLATTSVFISCAMSLAVFNVGKYVDESGNVVEPETRYSGGTIR
jgi:hypothetical protein